MNSLKKNLIFVIGLMFVSSVALGAKYFDDIRVDSIGVGTVNPSASNLLDVVSTTKSARPCPVMTETQRDAIASPALGACVTNSTSSSLNYYDGDSWEEIGAGLINPMTTDGDLISYLDDDPVRLAIGTAGQLLTVEAGAPVWKDQFHLIESVNGQTGEVELDVEDLLNVDVAGIGDGYVLRWNVADSEWKAAALPSDLVSSVNGETGAVVLDLGEINDVDTTAATDGYVLTYDGDTSTWVSAPTASTVNALPDLNDVTLTAPSDGQVLTYNTGTSQWVNESLPAPPVSSVNGETGAVVLDAGDVEYTVGQTVEEELNDIDAEIGVINGDISSIEGDITTINTDIGNLETAVDTIEDDITAIDLEIDGIQTNIDTVESNVATNTSDISTINGTLGTLNTTVSGKVTGPASAVDNRVPVFDGTTGKLIKQSAASIDTNADLSGVRNANVKNVVATGGSYSPADLIKTNDSSFLDSIGSWVSYKDTGAVPTDGTGGTPDGDFTGIWDNSNTDPLGTTYSLRISKSTLSTDIQGNGKSLDITVPAGYRDETVDIGYFHSQIGNDYQHGWITAFIYDVTNGVLLPTQNDNSVPIGSGHNSIKVYIPASTQSIRLIFHVTTTEQTLGFSKLFKNIKLKISEPSSVPIFQGPFSYTPTFTGMGTVTLANFKYYIYGSMIYISGRARTGTGTASPGTMTLPNGWTTPADIPSVSASGTVVRGIAAANTSYVLKQVNSNLLTFGRQNASNDAITPRNPLIDSEDFALDAWVPISQLSQNTIQGYANNFNPAKIVLNRTTSGQSGITTGQVQLNNFSISGSGLTYNTTNYRIYATRRIQLIPGGNLSTTISAANTGQLSVYWRVNGATQIGTRVINNTSASSLSTDVPTALITLEAGDYMELFLSNSGGTVTVNSSTTSLVTLVEQTFENTAINTGPISLSTEAWVDNQANATTSVRVRRSGTDVVVSPTAIFTGAMSGSFDITVPAAYTANLDFTGDKLYHVGMGLFRDTGTGSYYADFTLVDANTLRVRFMNMTSGALTNTSNTIPFTWANTDTITALNLSWPVVGW